MEAFFKRRRQAVGLIAYEAIDEDDDVFLPAGARSHPESRKNTVQCATDPIALDCGDQERDRRPPHMHDNSSAAIGLSLDNTNDIYDKEDDAIDFCNARPGCDVILQTDDSAKLFAHSHVLARGSTKLAELFDQGRAPAEKKRQRVLRTLDVKWKADVVIDLLTLVYCPARPITDQGSIRVLPVASQLGMRSVVDRCEQCLVNKGVPSLELLLLAQTHGLERLRKKCILSLAEQSFEDLQENDLFPRLNTNTQFQLLLHRVHELESEMPQNKKTTPSEEALSSECHNLQCAAFPVASSVQSSASVCSCFDFDYTSIDPPQRMRRCFLCSRTTPSFSSSTSLSPYPRRGQFRVFGHLLEPEKRLAMRRDRQLPLDSHASKFLRNIQQRLIRGLDVDTDAYYVTP